jgi:hypothetical protein
MHMAIKYSMDVGNAIVGAVTTSPWTPVSTKVARLAFMAEFPNRFPRSTTPRELFIEVCSPDYHPTADDLRPLMAHPSLVALMMQCRDGLSNPSMAIWGGGVPFGQTYRWVRDGFKSLGFEMEGEIIYRRRGRGGL